MENVRVPTFEMVPTHALRLDPKNPRHHSDHHVKQIAASIGTFGFCSPVLADANNNVIAGHGRILAAKQLGLTALPVARLSGLTDAQKRALQIADNRLTEHSRWNEELLGETLKELTVLELNFDLSVIGFSTAEIDLRINASESAAQSDADDDVIEAPRQQAVSKLGDCWALGKHRVLCGNAALSTAYNALMRGARAVTVFTDPPYNVRIDGHVTGLGRARHREFAMASGELNGPEFAAFLIRVLKLLAQHCVRGAITYVCMDWRHIALLSDAARAAEFQLKNICVWVKSNAGMGSFYRSQHEFVFVLKNGSARNRNNIELGRHGRNRTNVWHYSSPSAFGREGDEGNLLALHPTVKPVALIVDAILDCSARGETVLDPFLGSGSTLIAAERVGRICNGMEIDPLYVDTAIRRWQRHSGECAIHEPSGLSFDAISETGRI